MSIAIENITTEDLGWDEYSAIKDMKFYTILFRDDGEIDIYDRNDSTVRDESLYNELKSAAVAFRKGER